MDQESILLKYLVQHDELLLRTNSFIDESVFSPSNKPIVTALKDYASKHRTIPTKEALIIDAIDIAKASKDKAIIQALPNIHQNVSSCFDHIDKPTLDWCIEYLEEYTRGKKIYAEIVRAIDVYENPNRVDEIKSIPTNLRVAIQTKFDANIGTDLWGNPEDLFDLHNKQSAKVPFRIEWLNRVTDGGAELGSFNMINGGINVGKSLSLVSLAADYIKDGNDVLYISGELSELKILRRLESNLLNTNMADIGKMTKASYVSAMASLRESNRGYGRFYVKMFPTGVGRPVDIEQLLEELESQSFRPTVIMIDYIGIFKPNGKHGSSYEMYKALAEELRAIAQVRNKIIWSATQIGRGAMKDGSTSMADVAESIGVAATADFMIGVSRRPELDQHGLLLLTQEKSRYGEINDETKAVHIKVNRHQQRLYDTSAVVQLDRADLMEKAMQTVPQFKPSKPEFTLDELLAASNEGQDQQPKQKRQIIV